MNASTKQSIAVGQSLCNSIVANPAKNAPVDAVNRSESRVIVAFRVLLSIKDMITQVIAHCFVNLYCAKLRNSLWESLSKHIMSVICIVQQIHIV
jgi:hypothetical protein